jgi:hypothetical protein
VSTRLGLVLAVLACASVALPELALAQAGTPVPGPATVLDGPSPDIVGLSGLSVARDGTGAVVYLKDVSGVAHVFVSRLVGGVFQPPEQIDSTLPGPSSQPVIAAGNGGLLVIAFINGGSLWVVDRASATSDYQSPVALLSGASNPSVQMTNFGKAYIAFTAAASGGSGSDVRAAYYDSGAWALEPTPLNVSPADDAGTGPGRPAVGAANDGVAIVVWGENGHIYARRVWKTSPSVEYEQADAPTVSGWNEVSADDPEIGVEGNSSYADVVFREVLSNGPAQQERVLMNRLQGAVFDGVQQPDGLTTPAGEGADQPGVSDSEYGAGFVTSAHDTSNQVWASILQNDGQLTQTVRVDSLPNATAPYPTSGMDGFSSGLVAWQHDPGALGTPEIRARLYTTANGFGPELVLSSPALGPTNASAGLATDGDSHGDAAVAWVQGTGSSTQVVAAQLYQPPGSFAPSKSLAYARTTHPTLSWSAPSTAWVLSYQVSVGGIQVGQTNTTSLTVPATLSQGRHRWHVTAINPAGMKSTKVAVVFVDTLAPRVTVRLSGRRRAGAALGIHVSYSDTPPHLPARDGSGVSSVQVSWGDGTSSRIVHTTSHVYRRPGRYLLRVTVTDRAGNVTTIKRRVRIGS